ncbi:hypothetical protein BJX65DRAFT_309300 [Aspergillus insuetus]
MNHYIGIEVDKRYQKWKNRKSSDASTPKTLMDLAIAEHMKTSPKRFVSTLRRTACAAVLQTFVCVTPGQVWFTQPTGFLYGSYITPTTVTRNTGPTRLHSSQTAGSSSPDILCILSPEPGEHSSMAR